MKKGNYYDEFHDKFNVKGEVMIKSSRLKLSTKIIILVISICILFCLTYIFVMDRVGKDLYDEKYLKTRHLVEAAWHVMKHYDDQFNDGEMTFSQAQELAMETIENMKYEEKEYFWINDLEPKMIMHPNYTAAQKEEWYATDGLVDYADPYGTKLFVDFVKVCKANGSGFVPYYWTKPGKENEKPVSKISYVKLFKPWGWIVGSGIYLDDTADEIGSLTILILIIGLSITILSIFVTLILGGKITKPIAQASDDLVSSSSQITSASSQLSVSSQRIAAGNAEQASSIEETSATLQQIASIAKQNADNSRNMNQFVKNTNDLVQDAQGRMDETQHAMKDIAESGNQISVIIKAIDEIAFQTNLLALNAAVEAARAGEAGAGFAVVADEVRSLAHRSAESAKSTQGFIEEILKNIKNGEDTVNMTREAFTGVVDAILKTKDLVVEITNASEEQSKGIDNIEKAMSQLEEVIHTNASTSEQSASAANELNNQAEGLMEVVKNLNIVVKGRSDIIITEDHKRLDEASEKKTSKKLPKGHHEIIHDGEPQSNKEKVKEVKPEEVLPLDEEESGFKDFEDKEANKDKDKK